jgi:hypothetical protein
MKTIIQNLTAAMFIAASLQIHAQQALAPVQDSVVQAVADEAELTPIPATALPKTGTFWVMTTGYNGNLTALPYPTLPARLSALPGGCVVLESSICARLMIAAKSTFIALATRRTVSNEGILCPFSM